MQMIIRWLIASSWGFSVNFRFRFNYKHPIVFIYWRVGPNKLLSFAESRFVPFNDLFGGQNYKVIPFLSLVIVELDFVFLERRFCFFSWTGSFPCWWPNWLNASLNFFLNHLILPLGLFPSLSVVFVKFLLHFDSELLVLSGLNHTSNRWNLLLNFVILLNFLLPFLILNKSLDNSFLLSLTHLLLVLLGYQCVPLVFFFCFIIRLS